MADGHSDIFHVFFKRHKRLTLNEHRNIQGDVAIMRVSQKCVDSVVNLRRGDVQLADFLLER